MEKQKEWDGFVGTKWQKSINVRDFIQKNYEVYNGDSNFLESATEKTKTLWNKLLPLMDKERKRGILDIDYKTPSTITSHKPGYIDKGNEEIVGLQTDAPLKRAIIPNGGWRMVEKSLNIYNYPIDENVKKIFTEYRKTHNDGVFDVYPNDVRSARNSHIITGLPDAYGRGRIIGDYRRVPLYGTKILVQVKENEYSLTDSVDMSEETIRIREEISEQIKALNELTEMAKSYGFDISKPAKTFKEAVQWLYFGYLAAIKEQNGAAMSIGRNTVFFDIYAQRDLKNGKITEREIQEIIDSFVIKLRIVRFLRTPEYDSLFSGDPVWVTETIGGIGNDKRPLITKTSFRILQTLYNLEPAPEPNLTILWSDDLPQSFKDFATKVSIDTSALQFESDSLIRGSLGDDAAIACCVSPMKIGKQMQFFGARVNLAKALLYAINGGKDEITFKQIAPISEIVKKVEVLNYDDVWKKYKKLLKWLARVYVNTLNCIHYMHDKYSYERLEMALHDANVVRTMACGIAGLSVVADSLSAIKYAKVLPIFNDENIVVDYKIDGDFPKYGNDDDRADKIAVEITKTFMGYIKEIKTYRNAIHTQSVLTITSNVVYGKNTGNTPDGRKAGTPFAPGANPMNGRDTHGMLASALSVAKLPFEESQDGISLTSSISPSGLGKDKKEQVQNLTNILDNYFNKNGYHINVNVINSDTLVDAMEHPEKYPQLTIRVSGYAVNFIKLTKEQQRDVLSRTFHLNN